VSVIDTSSNTKVATVSLGAVSPIGVAITADGAFAYALLSRKTARTSAQQIAPNELLSCVPLSPTRKTTAGQRRAWSRCYSVLANLVTGQRSSFRP